MQYDLVFEGGGAKGFAFVGALQAFKEARHTPGRVLGTSAGAITATLLAAGFDIDDLGGALGERAADGRPIFATFLGRPVGFSDSEINEGALRKLLADIDIPGIPESIERRIDERIVRALAGSPRLCHLLAFFERGGWYGADAFLDWMRRTLNTGTHNGQPRQYAGLTLAEFHQQTGNELTLVAADTTDARKLILNHRTAPCVPIEWAVRMSMSVPLLWEEVVWQADWGEYRGREMTDHTVVDGGLLSNFPIELLVSDDALVQEVMGGKSGNKVIGFLIDETIAVPDAPALPGSAPVYGSLAEFAPVRRLRGLVETATRAADRGAIEEFEHLVVHLPAKGYGTTEFDMQPERRVALIAAGQQATETYLQGLSSRSSIQAAPIDMGLVNQRARKILDE